MKLKKWVEMTLIVIAIISGMAMMYDVEITMVPFIVGGSIFMITTGIIIEYGTLLNKLIAKIEELL